MTFWSFNLIPGAPIFKKIKKKKKERENVDYSEIVLKHAKFWFGVPFPLKHKLLFPKLALGDSEWLLLRKWKKWHNLAQILFNISQQILY